MNPRFFSLGFFAYISCITKRNMNIISLKSELIAAENLNSVRRSRGKHSLNLATEIAEELSALVFSELNGTEYEVAVASTKGYDIFTKEHKVEVKSVASMHRNIGNLKDKTVSNQIVVIWFAENTMLRVDRVVIYNTVEILEAVKADGNIKGLFTRKMQNEWYDLNKGQEITQHFQNVIDKVLVS